jgi:outer membrane protein
LVVAVRYATRAKQSGSSFRNGRGSLVLTDAPGVKMPVAHTMAEAKFVDLGRFQPYLGAGPAFMYVFDDNDGLMNRLKVKEAVGFAFQAGADFMIDQHWGLFVDAKKAILRTHATGFLGVLPVKADVKLDPLVLSGGLTYRF